MPNWDCLIDESALASLLPGEQARFAKPVSEALAIFLAGLPAEHQATILSDQASLALDASISQRLALLARRCPVLHKLGQILARDQRLSAEFRQHLRQLETLPPSVPWETIVETLTRELGPLDRLGIRLQQPALAEASVAVVVAYRSGDESEKDFLPVTKFSNRDGPGNSSSDHQPYQGVLKLLKPEIEQRLELELNLLGQVGTHLDERCDDLGIPHLHYEESFEQVRQKLCDEIRLDQEQRYLARARRDYAHMPQVMVPKLLAHCTPRVTAMERIDGVKITKHGLQAHRDQFQLAELVVEALVVRPIFSLEDCSLFHSDPHAGNLFYTSDRRLAILDWSLAGSLNETQRTAIVQIMLAALTLDYQGVVAILEGLAERQEVDRTALMVVVDSWLRRLRQGYFPGIRWLVGMLDEAVLTARLRVSSELMLFRKMLHALEGVVTAIGAEPGVFDRVLCREFLKHFAAEWPRRWLALPNSRQFATRLSNADLTRWMLSTPATATRFWWGQLRDLLAGTDLPGRILPITSSVGSKN
jgi:ubiquinone biosynthesis protein